jgi:hypothetical protein
MSLNPMTVLTDAIKAIPSLKFGLGVAGVVAAGMIAIGLANNRPQFAVLTFVFVLAGMFLLAIFVGGAKYISGEILTGPVILIVWVLTLAFVGLVIAFFCAFVFGKPEILAALINVAPASVRGESKEESSSIRTAHVVPPSVASAPASAADSKREEAPPSQPKVVSISLPFSYRGQDDNCDSNRIVPLQWCLPPGAKLTAWSGPSIRSANCGSQFENIRKVGENCLAVDARIKGCGYDNLLLARNCRGSGWIDGSFLLQGEAVQSQ